MEKQERTIQNILNSLSTQSLNAISRLRQMGRAGVPALMVALQHSDPVIRAGAARALGRLKDPTSVPALAAATEDPDSSVRLAAVLALSDIPGPEAVQALTKALHARHALVRDCASRALAHRSLDALRTALGDPDPVARTAAAHGIGYYARDRLSIPRLRALLRDESADVRRTAARALGWIAIHHAQAVDALREAQQHEEEEIRAIAARCLGRLDPAVATDALLCALRDPSPHVVEAAIRALGGEESEGIRSRTTVRDGRVITALLVQVQNGHARRRILALGALAHLLAAETDTPPNPAVLPALTQALADPDPQVRAAAALALGESREERAIEPLLKALQDPVWLVRASAAGALGRLANPAAIPSLEGALHDSDPAVARRAEFALQQIRSRSL